MVNHLKIVFSKSIMLHWQVSCCVVEVQLSLRNL